MSTENIIDKSGSAGHCFLTFALRSGETRTYEYFGPEAALAMAGTDPAQLHGRQVDGPSIDSGTVKNFLKNVSDIAEAVEADAAALGEAAAETGFLL